MQSRLSLALAAIAFLFVGCAGVPQNPVQLAPDTLTSKTSRIGVAMTPLPKVDTHLPGAGCLLCLAAASIANSSLTTHTQKLPYEDLPKLKNDMADLIRKKGSEVTVITKDFSSLQKKHNIDKLLVVDVTMLGMLRTYSAYIPTSDPKGVLQGLGYLVNLSNNTYEWYMPVYITKSADGAWDEPPSFPGLTNAYFQALEMGKDSFLKPFNN